MKTSLSVQQQTEVLRCQFNSESCGLQVRFRQATHACGRLRVLEARGTENYDPYEGLRELPESIAAE